MLVSVLPWYAVNRRKREGGLTQVTVMRSPGWTGMAVPSLWESESSAVAWKCTAVELVRRRLSRA